MRTTKNVDVKPYFIATFFITMFVTVFLTLNLVPVITKSGDSNAATTDVNLEINPVIALSLTKENISLDIIPTGAGAFVYDTTIANVSTNNKTGYTLTMNTKTNETALVQEGTDHKVASLTGDVAVTASNQTGFTINSWGYARSNGLNTTDNTIFSKIPRLNNPDTIAYSDEPTLGSSTPVTFAARLNTSTVSGIYTNTMTFSATTNYAPKPDDPTFSGITTMQEMNTRICAAETTPTKEATELTTIHSEDTNLVPEATLTDTRDGQTYIVRKLADGNCWMTQNLRLRLVAGKTLTSEKTDTIADFTPSRSTQDSEGPVWQPYTETHSYDTGNVDYGVSYNWYAATAGTGTNYGEEALASICPKNWRLPGYSDVWTEAEDKTMPRLILIYGTNTSVSFGAISEQVATSAPLSFVFSGSYSKDYYGNGVYSFETCMSGGCRPLGSWHINKKIDSWSPETTLTSFSLGPGNANGLIGSAYDGAAIRCVAR